MEKTTKISLKLLKAKLTQKPKKYIQKLQQKLDKLINQNNNYVKKKSNKNL